MQVTIQLHAPADLVLLEETCMSIGQETEWSRGSVWMWRRRVIFLSSLRIEFRPIETYKETEINKEQAITD